MKTMLKHYLVVPDNPCFHMSDCDCSPTLSQVYISHNIECATKEMYRFKKKDGVEIIWEEFDCEVGRLIYNNGLENLFCHYLEPSFRVGKSSAKGMLPGKYEIEPTLQCDLKISSCIEQ